MKNLLVVALSALIVWSCNKATDKEKDTNQVLTQKQHENENLDVLHLNSDKKWIVNNEMKPFVLQGENLVNSYVSNNQTDYATLAKKIKEQNDQLIKSCTMDGASHDELHKWLHPHLELTQKLNDATNANNAQTTVTALQKSYQEYHNYFN